MRMFGLGEEGGECRGQNAKGRRKKKLWLSFCLLCSAWCIHWVSVAATRADDYYDDGTPEARGLLSGMFNEKGKAPSKNDKKPPAEAIRPRPTVSVVSAEAERQRHENALIRRWEVCQRLRMIADQTGNEALWNQANELEERANLIYRQQTAGLPMPARTPLAVLANERQNLNGGPGGSAVMAPIPISNSNLGASGNGPSPSSSAARLDGNMDQREQSILNGTSMGGN